MDMMRDDCQARLELHSKAHKATKGKNYFFMFTHDYGPCTWKSEYFNTKFMKYHTVGSHGMSKHPCFDVRKDIAIPTSNTLQPVCHLISL